MYQIALIMIGCTIIFTTALCLLINWAIKQEDKRREKEHRTIAKTLMPNWSLHNAMIINRKTCVCPGNIRLSMGLYRTSEEADKYIEESLKRPLP